MWGTKGYGFRAILVWNRVWILTILVCNRVRFVRYGLQLGMVFRRSYIFIIILSWEVRFDLYWKFEALLKCPHKLKQFLDRSEIGYWILGQFWN